jgi:DNA-binding CsgD family transcriptional regulator
MMPYGREVLVGRLDERLRIERLLEGARRGQSGALVISGEAGIGKTTLLRHAADRAGEMTVLSATGVPAETDLEYSGLLELARPILHRLDELSEHQQAALRESLGLDPPRARDRFVVAAALLSLLAVAAEQRPLLVLIDDAQWLDRASAEALRFAARRMFADRAVFLFAMRDGEGGELSNAGFEELHVEGLALQEVALLLERSGGSALPPDSLARVHEAMSGNPLALIELGGMLTTEQIAAWPHEVEPLPLASRLERAFSARVSGLPDDTRAALLIVAISTIPELEAVVRGLDVAGLTASALEPAEDRGFLSITDGRVLFRHPLLRSAVYHAATSPQRRRAHRALADSLTDQDDLERRASHLAGAALGPDEEVAATLAAAAARACGRTGFAASATALEKAARLTPDPNARLDRLAEAADMAWVGGDFVRALGLLDAAEPLAAVPAQRARMLYLRGRIERQVGVSSRACRLLLEAAELVDDEEPVEAARYRWTATVALFAGGDLPTAVRLTRRLRELVPREGGIVDAHAEEALGVILALSGRIDEATPMLERAVGLLLAPDQPGWHSHFVASVVLGFLERTQESGEMAVRAARLGRDAGPRALLTALELLTRWEIQTGRWALAGAHGDEALGLARALGLGSQIGQLLVQLARVDAARGDVDRCQERVEEARRLCAEHELVVLRSRAEGGLGVLELTLGRYHDAAGVLRAVCAEVERVGVHERDNSPHPDLIEALIRVERRSEAAAVLDRYTLRASVATPLWGGALVARCRGLLADDESFTVHFDEALDLHARVEDRFQEARTLLCYGERLRRTGNKSEARVRLRAALERFDELRAAPWADRAQRELRATGERIRRSRPAAGQELTPQELQVALPVAEGKTNKEAAAALFLSPKTVEFHLASVYRKLGVTSRRDLIKRVSTEGVEALAKT